MKRSLLSLLMILPIACYAQNFEVALNGGFSFHSLPAKNDYTHEDKTVASYAASFKAGLLFEHSQIGVGAEMCTMKEYNYFVPPYTQRIYTYLAKPLITPFVYYNRMYHFGAGYFYAGLMGGPAVASVGVNNYQYANGPYGNITGYTTSFNSTIGFEGGAQIGLVFDITSRMGINVEAALRYAAYSYKDPNSTYLDNPYNYRVFYFPMTAGIRYRI
jgi:hypothetical protein